MIISVCRVYVGLCALALILWYNSLLWCSLVGFREGAPLWAEMVMGLICALGCVWVVGFTWAAFALIPPAFKKVGL